MDTTTDKQDELPTEEELAILGDSPEDNAPMAEATIKKAAALAASGAVKYKVQKALGISQYYVNKIWRDELFKKTVEDIGNDAVEASKSTTKNALAKLSGLAIKALEYQLKKNNLQAAVTVLRSLGVETGKDTEDKGGGITLVLAGQNGAADKKVNIGADGKERE